MPLQQIQKLNSVKELVQNVGRNVVQLKKKLICKDCFFVLSDS
jgi:hypothetical protein